MKYLACFFLLWSLNLAANESAAYFQAAPENKVLCKVSESAYKLVSQKNAVIVQLRGHDYFKLKDENLYISQVGCFPLDGKHEAIIF